MTDKATHTPLPCEDCSSTDLEVCWTEIGSTKHWHVLCNDCSNERSGFTEAEALTAWNTRAVNSHHDLVEALRHVTACLVDELGNLADENEVGDEDLAAVLGIDYARQIIAARLRIRQSRAILTKTEAGQ